MYCNNEIDYLKFLRNKELYIFGAGNRGRNIAQKFEDKEYCIKSYIDNSENKIGTALEDIPIISLNEFMKVNSVDKVIIVCGYEREISSQLLQNNIYNFVCESHIDFGGGMDHYDESYFRWQQPIGEFSAKVKVRLFQKYINKEMTVLEFGSGGGFLLKELQAKEKLGIDINDSARKFAQTIGIRSVKYVSDVEDEFADVIISTNVLEHVENPLGELRELYKKLKFDGKIVFYVPNESCDVEYTRSEFNNHLYTWNCLNIGNLFKAAGFFVHSVERIQEVWPGNYQAIGNEVSEVLFDAISEIGGKASNENRCLIVAYK